MSHCVFYSRLTETEHLTETVESRRTWVHRGGGGMAPTVVVGTVLFTPWPTRNKGETDIRQCRAAASGVLSLPVCAKGWA